MDASLAKEESMPKPKLITKDTWPIRQPSPIKETTPPPSRLVMPSSSKEFNYMASIHKVVEVSPTLKMPSPIAILSKTRFFEPLPAEEENEKEVQSHPKETIYPTKQSLEESRLPTPPHEVQGVDQEEEV